ncbi:MAG: DUF5682 family protein [Planctomycetota bacterium]
MTDSLDQVHVFGIRHLSPSGAWHLRRFLDQKKPKAVLIEGLSDAGALIPDMTRRGTVPPIAILAYTEDLPVGTVVYPIARYSPEYQALVWAKQNRARAEWIDLPSDVFLALQSQQRTDETPLPDKELSKDSPEQRKGEAPQEELDVEARHERESLYERFARHAGEPDYETYWERNFEHNLTDDSYRLAAIEFGAGLREFDERSPQSDAENLVREAYMRRRIQETIDAGMAPEDIVVLVGAYHASAIGGHLPAMTDDELSTLKRRPSKLTLMPYSYFKLSSQSGYGAGNHAPAYFELLWESLQEARIEHLPSRYLSMVARHTREQGTHRSTAEVIEGVRLAQSLAALKGGQAPTLADLRDAATTLIGHGEVSSVSQSMAYVEVGTAIGQLPAGVSQTSIQDDFERQLARYKLTKYRTTVKQELGLDLRENRRAKSEEAAYLDLNRSSLLHRLRVIGVEFAVEQETHQDSTTWAEKWHVQWSTESEIQLVEAVLLGETIEVATGYSFKSKLSKCESVAEAASMVSDACKCGMIAAMDQARQRLQELASGTSEFRAIAHAANRLGMIARYGDVRQFDPEPLMPLVEDLFVQGSLALIGAANCDDAAAKSAVVAIDELNKVNLEYSDRVDENLWVGELRRLADSDQHNPLLSGYACAILLERNLVDNEDLAREMSRRLSPGIDADLGAGWFEGLSKRNRYALLARQPLWEQLAGYVESLEEGEFLRALVFLRRSFGGFSPQEKRHIAENLGEYWGAGADVASEMLSQPLTNEEEQSLEELSDFDFDDL